MLVKSKVTGSTIAYQLRPHKAIERNLFITLLKKLDRIVGVDLENYRYVGFGAAFLEDFKILHAEFGIKNMDCIEMDEIAYSRQVFNNPFNFIKLYNLKSTDYITDSSFKQDLNQIVWWDFASPKLLKESLNDIELTAEKGSHYDILKFTFNAEINSFVSAYRTDWKEMGHPKSAINYKEVLKYLESDVSFKNYVPEGLTWEDIHNDFSTVIRSFAIRAVKRGLSNAETELDFLPLCSFDYSDGTIMTTVTGIICKKSEYKRIMNESGLKNWEFLQKDLIRDLMPAISIKVPVMTVIERAEIDKIIHSIKDPEKIAKKLRFQYGTSIDEHIEFIEGYCKYYRFLPYYSKVIF